MAPREPYNWPTGPSQAIRDIEADFAQLRARYSYLPQPSRQEREYAAELAARVAAVEARKIRHLSNAPARSVYTVVISPNNHPGFDDIKGWLENWCWIPESPHYPTLPYDWKNRYSQTLFGGSHE